MCLTLLQDSRLYELLLAIDRELAETARAAGCACGGRLHRANFDRKPRGGLSDLAPEHDKRFSYCCALEGCRSRKTPASVRFLGRRVYLGAVMVLVSALHGGVTDRRAAELHEALGVSRRTLLRWRSWWRQTFPGSAFWRSERNRFMPPLSDASLPSSLFVRFSGEDERTRLIQVLSFLAPLTTRSC